MTGLQVVWHSAGSVFVFGLGSFCIFRDWPGGYRGVGKKHGAGFSQHAFELASARPRSGSSLHVGSFCISRLGPAAAELETNPTERDGFSQVAAQQSLRVNWFQLLDGSFSEWVRFAFFSDRPNSPFREWESGRRAADEPLRAARLGPTCPLRVGFVLYF